ncbi:MAG TPA: hypothetical protein VIF14_06990 [Alphaproteobacteria bacterium]
MASLALPGPALAEPPKRITVDWAHYNPVSLALTKKGWIEEGFETDGIAVGGRGAISTPSLRGNVISRTHTLASHRRAVARRWL